MTLLTLERKLRNGETPDSMGLRRIGEGAQKKAYIVKCDIRDYVVKLNTGGYRLDAKICPNLQKYGIIRVIQKQVNGTPNGDWLIQEATTPLDGSGDSKAWEVYTKFNYARRQEDYKGPRGDFHSGNFGVTKSGRLVCFDW